MTDLLLFAAVVLLVLIWFSIGKASAAIAQQTARMSAYFEQMNELMQDIQERLRDNFETDDEKQHRVDMTP